MGFFGFFIDFTVINFSISDMSSEETTQTTGKNLHEESKVLREMFIAFMFVAFWGFFSNWDMFNLNYFLILF